MLNTGLSKEIYQILKSGCFNGPDDSVYVSDGDDDNIHVAVVSEKFEGLGMEEKRDLILSDLVQQLPDNWTKVSLAIGVSPEEILAS